MTIQLPRVRAEAQEGEDRASARAREEPRAPVEPGERDTALHERTPGETDRAGKDLEAGLDKLQEAANTASAHARNVYLTFLLFGLYLAIIFGSTTHEQLLRESPVTLPLLDVGLPLVGFYWVAPALFVLLHLNLLLELYLLSGRLHRLDSTLAASGDEHDRRAGSQRLQLYPFHFSQMLIGRQHGRLIRLLFWLIVWLTVLVLPVILLLAGQVRFLPYHDAWTTMWHRALVAADLLLILIFWRVIRHPADRPLAHPGRWLRHQAKVLAGALPALVLSFLIFTLPGDSKERFLSEDRSFLGRNLVVRETNLVGDWPTQAQIDQYGEDLAWKNFGAPPSLGGRDLRHADFSYSIFVRGDLRGANLRGANLWRANLQGAALEGANLQGAALGLADLQGAVLAHANLQGADLRGAKLWQAALNAEPSTYHLADLRRLDLVPPAQSDLKQWIADAKEIADEQARQRVLEALYRLTGMRALEVLRRLRRELGLATKDNHPPWPPNFPPGLSEREDVLFEPVPPPTFAEFDPKLAKFLAGMACDPNAPSRIAETVANRAIYENEPGRLYPVVVAKALLGASCPPAKELDEKLGEGEFQRLRELLVEMQPSKGNAGSP